MPRAYESSVVQTTRRSPSLRTTIPEAVVGMLGLDPGDKLMWETEPGSLKVTVSRKVPRKARP